MAQRPTTGRPGGRRGPTPSDDEPAPERVGGRAGPSARRSKLAAVEAAAEPEHPSTTMTEMPDDEPAPAPARPAKAPPKGKIGARAATRLADVEVQSPRGRGEDDDGEDGEDEPARADDSDATHAGPPVTLEVLEGPDKGKKKRVSGGRMVIGRGDGCDLKLRDTSTSRRHLEVIVGFSGIKVRDLGSGNGTKVNGDVVDEVALVHGDEIQLGVTIIKVVDELKAMEERRRPKVVTPPPEVEPAEDEEAAHEHDDGEAEAFDDGTRPPAGRLGTEQIEALPDVGRTRSGEDDDNAKKKLVVIGGLIVGAMVIIFVMMKAITPKPVEPRGGPAPAAVVPGNTAAELRTKVASAIVSKQYDQGLDLVSQLEKADPKNEEIPLFRKRIADEKEGTSKLAMAQSLVANNNFKDARAALAAVPESSDAHDQAETLTKTLNESEATYLVGLSKFKLTGASGLDDPLLADVDGIVTRLNELQSLRVTEVATALSARKDELTRDERRRGASAAAGAAHRREQKKNQEALAVRQELESGYRKFDVGEYDRASSEFDHIAERSTNPAAQARARVLSRRVKDFAQAYKTARELDVDQNIEAEAKPLETAMRALEDIDPNSPKLGEMRNKLAHCYVMKGRSANARTDYGAAASAYRHALDLKPGLGEAKEGIQSLASKANDVYMQAYAEEPRDAENAVKLYQAVLNMTQSGEALNDKAKKRLESLGHAP